MINDFTTEELQFYEKQMMLSGFGIMCQKTLRDSSVLVVGAGGLGCPILQYLTSMGIGTLGILDGDVIEMSNLCRQPLYNPGDVGKQKVCIAKDKLSESNPFIKIEAIPEFLSERNIKTIFSDYDIIVGATDTIFSYYLIDEACAQLNKPFIYGAVFQNIGHLAVFNFPKTKKRSRQYQDLFPCPPNPSQLAGCADAGILGYTPAIIAIMQVIKTVEVLTNDQNVAPGNLWVFNSEKIQIKQYRIPKISIPKFSILTSPVQLTSLEIETTFKSNTNTLLVDIRSSLERSLGHVGGQHIPLNELENFFEQCSIDDSVVLYCQKGIRSSLAALKARQNFNRSNIFSLDGGYIKNKTINFSPGKKTNLVEC